jgi:arylsulfatase
MAIRRVRSFWLAAASVLAVWAAAARGVPAASAQAATPPDIRPNVVVVLVDDMGWSDIGPFGSEIATPNLDALAARGVRFTQFYATPRCSPTRASLLTGLYSHQAGMGHLDNVIRRGSRGTTGRLNDQSVTIAEVLREAGYFTAMSGKWHLGQDNGTPPWARGFERTLSLRAGGMYFPNQNYTGGDNPLASRAKEPLFLNGVATPRDAPVFGSSWYATYLWTEFGLKFIDEARRQQALLPVSSVQRAAFSVDGSGGPDRQVPRPVQGRLGPHAAGALSAADPNGAHRREVAAESA